MKRFKFHGFTAEVQPQTKFLSNEIINGAYQVSVTHNRSGGSLGIQYIDARNEREAAKEAVKDARRSL